MRNESKLQKIQPSQVENEKKLIRKNNKIAFLHHYGSAYSSIRPPIGPLVGNAFVKMTEITSPSIKVYLLFFLSVHLFVYVKVDLSTESLEDVLLTTRSCFNSLEI